MSISRRRLMQTAGTVALANPLVTAASMPEIKFEGKDTPKICLAIGDGGGLAGGTSRGATAAVGNPGAPRPTGEEASARRNRQPGVEWILSGGMLLLMREPIRNKYARMVYPEHPRALDYDREHGRIGGYTGGGSDAAYAFNVGYARAMMQAALTV